MFRALALKTVRQQQDDAAHAQPLGFAGTDELVDDHLGAVGEITKLGFPQDQGLGVGEGITIFESENASLAKRAVHDFELGLIAANLAQREITFFRFLIDQGGVTV
jgi:hypothetical protein